MRATRHLPRPLWLLLCVPLCGPIGCAAPDPREVTITAKPEDAIIYVDGQERGRGPVVERLKFDADARVHTVSARRYGYQEDAARIDGAWAGGTVELVLEPRARKVTFRVAPVPAVVSVDGQPLSADRVGQITTSLRFTVDRDNRWVPHTVTAERPGYEPADLTVNWTDQFPTGAPEYTLTLNPKRKDITVTTEPPGAEILLDGETQSSGPSPVEFKGFEVRVDPQTDQWVPRKVRAVKKGYLPAEDAISWNDGQTTYRLTLQPQSKQVKVVTDPPGATVLVDGRVLERDATGAAVATLPFPPATEGGSDLKTYTAVATLKTAEREYEAATFPIAWEDGRQEYQIALKEVKTRFVTLLRPKLVLNGKGGSNEGGSGSGSGGGVWHVEAERLATVAARDTAEPGGATVTRVGGLPEGSMIDTLATSPDGMQLVFSVLTPELGGGLRSQMYTTPADGSASPRALGDGKSLDLTPDFSPDGMRVLFSSDRENGRRLAVWSVAADGSAPPERLTVGEATDLFPSLDSAPRPRLFYERRRDGEPDPLLQSTQAKTNAQADLGRPGRQPRVSPRADLVLYVAADSKTGKGDLFTIPVEGGEPTRLTETPADECDPVWSRDGSRVAFVSDRPAKAGDKPGDRNIWIMDPSKPGEAVQVTANESWDDCPAWDATGRTLYFRSNRGGEWGIWKIDVAPTAKPEQ